MPKLSIIIPVYNEKNTIREILKRIEAVKLDGIDPVRNREGPSRTKQDAEHVRGFVRDPQRASISYGVEKEIIIIDDFSTDGTREILENLDRGYKVFFQNKNIGKGQAIKMGFKEASGNIVLIQDADLEYEPDDYPRLIQPIIKGQVDVVYGSRFLKSEISRQNKIIYRHGYLFSKSLNWLSNVLSGLWLSDMYTGYKVFSARAVKTIMPEIKSERFGIDPELTALVAKNKFRVLEIPIRYQGRTYREGKKINWKDGLAAIFHIIRFNLFN